MSQNKKKEKGDHRVFPSLKRRTLEGGVWYYFYNIDEVVPYIFPCAQTLGKTGNDMVSKMRVSSRKIYISHEFRNLVLKTHRKKTQHQPVRSKKDDSRSHLSLVLHTQRKKILSGSTTRKIESEQSAFRLKFLLLNTEHLPYKVSSIISK